MNELPAEVLESLRWTLESLRLAGVARIPHVLPAAAPRASAPAGPAEAASGAPAQPPGAVSWGEAARKLREHIETGRPIAAPGAGRPPATAPAAAGRSEPPASSAGRPPPARAPQGGAARAPGAAGGRKPPDYDDTLRPARRPDPAVEAKLAEVAQRVSVCTRCPELVASRSRTVFADGRGRAELMFIGEGPGEDEDRQGVPFVGRAGQLLTQIITYGMRMRREDVYICNIVKCRPPENRQPLPPEAANCREYLDAQIELIRPRVICCLGGAASKFLLDNPTGVTKLRGQWLAYRGIPVMATFHPAYLLRNYTADTRAKVWDDVKKVVEKLRELRAGPAAAAPAPPRPPPEGPARLF